MTAWKQWLNGFVICLLFLCGLKMPSVVFFLLLLIKWIFDKIYTFFCMQLLQVRIRSHVIQFFFSGIQLVNMSSFWFCVHNWPTTFFATKQRTPGHCSTRPSSRWNLSLKVKIVFCKYLRASFFGWNIWQNSTRPFIFTFCSEIEKENQNMFISASINLSGIFGCN